MTTTMTMTRLGDPTTPRAASRVLVLEEDGDVFQIKLIKRLVRRQQPATFTSGVRLASATLGGLHSSIAAMRQ